MIVWVRKDAKMKKISLILLIIFMLTACKQQIDLKQAIDIISEYADFNDDTMTIIQSKTENDAHYIMLEDGNDKIEAKVDFDGNIIMFNRLDDSLIDDTNNEVITNNSIISEMESCLSFLLEHLKLSENDIYNLKMKQDVSRNKTTYTIDFDTQDYEYEYDIDPLEMTIIKEEKERNNNRTIAFEKSFDRSVAIEIALQANQLNNSDITNLQIEETFHGNISVYEIDYYANGIEYEISIDANSKELLSNKID